MDKSAQNRRTKLTGIAVFAGAAVMVGVAFASVPLYRLFCEAVGFGGATKVATTSPEAAADIPMTVRFDANTDKQLPWKFEPVEKSVALKLGETKTIHYRATNLSDHVTTGSATFNVTPQKIGQYFNKLECFCFQEQTLQPGQSVELGVTFFIDPALIKNNTTDEVRTITLSYTFFRSKDGLPLEDNAAVQKDSNTRITLAPTGGAAPVN